MEWKGVVFLFHVKNRFQFGMCFEWNRKLFFLQAKIDLEFGICSKWNKTMFFQICVFPTS
jgi:hypothetical protein